MASPESYVPGSTPGAVPAGWDATGQNLTVPGTLTVTGTITGPGVVDQFGHPTTAAATGLIAATVGVTTAGTISGTTAAGAAPTVTAVTANDRRGVFTLNPVTGGGAQAAGPTANVTFVVPYTVAPTMVLVECMDITTPTSPADQSAYATTVTAAGFQLSTSVLTTAHNYHVTYVVVA
jgi:hypothetical protein